MKKEEFVALLNNDDLVGETTYTQAITIAKLLSKTEDREYIATYQLVCIDAIADILATNNKELVSKYYAFIRTAKLPFTVYELIARYIQTDFPENGLDGLASNATIRFKSILFVVKAFPDLFVYEWIKDTSAKGIAENMWAYLDILYIYDHPALIPWVDTILPSTTESVRLRALEHFVESAGGSISELDLVEALARWKKFIPKDQWNESSFAL